MVKKCGGFTVNHRSAIKATSAIVCSFGLLWTTACSASNSNAVAATSVESLLANAQPGDSITLPAGRPIQLKIYGRRFSTPVTIDLSQATVQEVEIRNSSGIRVVNGTVAGPGIASGASSAVRVADSNGIELSNLTVTGVAHGILLSRSSDVVVQNVNLTGIRSDGIVFSSLSRSKILNNSCSDFSPIEKEFDDAGKMISDTDHPDCIQGFANGNQARNSDVEISGNRGVGNFQGIFVHNGDRYKITDNDMEVATYHGVTMGDSTDSVVTRNKISTVPETWDVRGRSFRQKIAARLTIHTGTNNHVCDNSVNGKRAPESGGAC